MAEHQKSHGDPVKRLAFTYQETSKAAGISSAMVRKLVRQGKLEAVKIGRSVRIPRREVLRLCGAKEGE